MGILNFLFFSQPKRRKVFLTDKSKLSKQDILEIVRRIDSLDIKQKKLISDELCRKLDDGGVSKWEYQEILRRLSLKRVELGLSEVDINNLKIILH